MNTRIILKNVLFIYKTSVYKLEKFQCSFLFIRNQKYHQKIIYRIFKIIYVKIFNLISKPHYYETVPKIISFETLISYKSDQKFTNLINSENYSILSNIKNQTNSNKKY